MKKTWLSLALASLVLTNCANKKNNEHARQGDDHEHITGSHKHQDGSVHENHPGAAHHQEEFKVGADSAAQKAEKEHRHSIGEESHNH